MNNDFKIEMRQYYIEKETGEKKYRDFFLGIIVDPSLGYKYRIINYTYCSVWNDLYDTYEQAKEAIFKLPYCKLTNHNRSCDYCDK